MQLLHSKTDRLDFMFGPLTNQALQKPLTPTCQSAGDPRRLVYGLDSHGLLCGANNTYKDSFMDLIDKPNLYYLDALELLNPTNIMYARTVCVASCPTVDDQCALSSLPCTNNTQYR